MASTFYEILGVSRYATDADIKKAFKELAKKYHPDKHPGEKFYEEHFKKINEAYQTLSDAQARKTYDLRLHYAQNPQQQQNRQTGNNQQRSYQRPPQATYAQSNYRKPNSSGAKPRSASEQKKLNSYYTYIAIGSLVFIMGCYWFYNFMNEYSSKKYFTEGLKEELKGNNAQAMGYYLEALDKNMNSPEINEKMGDIYTKLSQNNSLELFYFNLELQKNYTNENEAASNELYSDIQGIDSVASLYYKRAYENYESNTDKLRTGLKIVKSLLKIGSYSAALNQLNSIDRLQDLKENDSLIYYRGDIGFHQKKYSEARKFYELFLVQHPKSYESIIKIGLCHFNEGNEDFALASLNRAIKGNPQKGEAYYFKGQIRFHEKDLPGACSLFYKADSLNVLAAKAAIYTYCRN